MQAKSLNDGTQMLSSPQTPFAKLLAALWCVGFGAVTLAAWMGLLVGKHGASAPEPIKVIFTLIWIGVTIFLARQFGALKQVRVDDRNLYVSDGRSGATIPLGQIAAVEPEGFNSHQRVTISLRRSCVFGDRIVFFPKKTWSVWRTHPVVVELRRRARLV